jgi:uncharacterized coiled-coil protein SlyX
LLFFHTPVKSASHAISTLSPVRRAAAFFAFLGFLTLTSCGEKEKTHVSLLDKQASVVNELHDVISDSSVTPEEAADKIVVLIEQFKKLKRETSELKAPSEEEIAAIASHRSLPQAHEKLLKLIHRLDSEAPETAHLISLIQGLHDPVPMTGEGITQ